MSIFGNTIDLYRDYLMINEAYVGKTPILEQIEQEIGKLRKKVSYYNTNNTLKETLRINRLFEKQFGMDVFGLHIYPSEDANGYTMVLGTNFDIAKYEVLHDCVVADSTNGYRFKPGNNFCIQVFLATSMFTDDTLTDEEIVAVILHEIGHNFADCIYDDIEIANRDMMLAYKKALGSMLIASALLSVLTLGLYLPHFVDHAKAAFSKQFKNEKKNKYEKKQQHHGKGFIKSILKGLKGKKNDLFGYINELVARLGGDAKYNRYYRIQDILHTPDKIRKSLGRQNEIIADKFAGIYGYGPAQASSLLKMSEMTSKAYKTANKISSKANSKFEKAILKINNYDVHPQSIQRAMEEVKLLKNELKKEDLDPKVRKVIEDQLNELYRVMDEFCTKSDELDSNTNARRVYNAYIRDEFPDAVDEDIEDRIEQALEDALNGKKPETKKKIKAKKKN